MSAILKSYLCIWRRCIGLITVAIILAGGSTVLASDGSGANTLPYSLSGSIEVSRVSDGDSLRSGKLKIRLFGIDAPEIKQQCSREDGTRWPCGLAAKEALSALATSTPQLECRLHDVDRYGRVIMQCFAGDIDIGAALVEQGLALAYRDYSKAYIPHEQTAAKQKRGIWNGEFVKPWEWRRKTN